MPDTPLKLYEELKNLIERFRYAKPQDRSELARTYAVSITELEKALAYFHYNCVMEWKAERE